MSGAVPPLPYMHLRRGRGKTALVRDTVLRAERGHKAVFEVRADCWGRDRVPDLSQS
jgi:hypothetical protein